MRLLLVSLTVLVSWFLVTMSLAVFPAHASMLYAGAPPGIARVVTVRAVAAPPSQPRTWTVRPGQTLSGIAAAAYGNVLLWPALWWVNKAHVKNPDLILTGQVLILSAWHPQAGWLYRAAKAADGPVVSQGTAVSRGTDGDGDHDGDTTDHVPVAADHAAVSRPAAVIARPVGGGTLSYAGLESLWTSAGGNPGYAPLAACIAEHESGGNQYATGPVGERGYWQINPDHGALSTYDPYGNARAAIIISSDGTNWSAWTTAPMCGV